MVKFHIRKDGTPGKCTASKGTCPLGGQSAHFETEDEARASAQVWLEDEYGLVDTIDKKTLELNYNEAKRDLEGFTGSVAETDALRTALSDANEALQQENASKGDIGDRLSEIHTPDGGATFTLDGLSPTTGFCASPYPEHSKVFNNSSEVTFESLAEYVSNIDKTNPELFAEPETYLGLWNDPSDGKVYLDVSKRYKTAEAARFSCEENDQIAFFDLNTFESVDVDRNAKSGQ